MDLRHWAIHQLAMSIHNEVALVDPDMESQRSDLDWAAATQYVHDRPGIVECVRRICQEDSFPIEDTLEAYDRRYGQRFWNGISHQLFEEYDSFETYLPSPPFGARRGDKRRPKSPIDRWCKNHLAGIIYRTVKGPEQRWGLDESAASWLLRQEPGSALLVHLFNLVGDERPSEQEFIERYGRVIFEHWQAPLRGLFATAPMRSLYGAPNFN